MDTTYLTSVDYNDGLANKVQSWSYDAAGNRVSDSAKPGTWTYDNLNRMSGSPMASYTHDAVGNRLTKVSGGNTTSYGWDAVNRMIESGPVNGSRNSYKYRADGMRVRKEIPGLVEKVYYGGQMPVETFEDFSTGNDKLTRNFVGARGIEMMETTAVGNTTQAYPLYDTHGNMVATLSKNSVGTSWSVANERSFDVWGSVRSGSGPKNAYCANLGHVQDDESGLVYMRARYYEPENGRFSSQDRVNDGRNWYVYCANNPVGNYDPSGNSYLLEWQSNVWRYFMSMRGGGPEDAIVFLSMAWDLYVDLLMEASDGVRAAKATADAAYTNAGRPTPDAATKATLLQQAKAADSAYRMRLGDRTLLQAIAPAQMAAMAWLLGIDDWKIGDLKL